jgi:hypothetical protein
MKCFLARPLFVAGMFFAPLFLALAHSAQASPILVQLDLISGELSNLNGALTGNDTYDEDGFRLQMDNATDHLDANVFDSNLYFHNGFSNPGNIHWTLSRGGAIFDLLQLDLAALVDGASSLTLTGSNDQVQVLETLGQSVLSGFTDVSWVKFDIAPDVGSAGVGIDSLEFAIDSAIIPEPRMLFLMGLALVSLVAFQHLHKTRNPLD